MQKAGLTHEGTLRGADKNNQGICDATYYGILAEDYWNLYT
jgi:ribosomal-protein-alanine N-acetyltransferase